MDISKTIAHFKEQIATMETTVDQLERLQLLQSGKRKRGRPVGSGKKVIEAVGGIARANASTRRRSLAQKRRWAKARRSRGVQEA